MRACLTLFPQCQLKRFPPYLCEDCISLKCRTEALLRLTACFRWDPGGGCWSSVLPTEPLCRGGSPLPATVWDPGAACPQLLLSQRAWKHVSRKSPWPSVLHHVAFCGRFLYLHFLREVLLFQIKCRCRLVKEWWNSTWAAVKEQSYKRSAEPRSC